MWNWTENQMTIAWIRHGATASNREHRYLGKTDESLDETGRRELTDLKKEGRYPKIDLLFVSPMKRCKETAEILYPGTPWIEIPEWTEMDFGEFEMKNYQELSHDQRYQDWIDSGGTLAFPGGESREAFILRAVRGLERMRTYLNTSDTMAGTIGCVVHGGTIMAVLSHELGGDYFDYQLPNGGIFMWIPSGSGSGGSLLASTSNPAHRKPNYEDRTDS